VASTIWIINQYAGSPQHGMEFRHYYLAKEFNAKGYRTIIISGSYSHLYYCSPKVEGNYTQGFVNEIEYWWIKVPQYSKSLSIGRVTNMLVFALKLWFFPKTRLPKPTHIITSSPSPFPISIASIWAKKLKSKLIYEVRDLWPLTLIELGGMSKLNPLVLFFSYFERIGLKRADVVVSVLPNAIEYFLSKDFKPKKYVIIANGISHEMLDSQTIELPIDDKRFKIVYLGSIGVSNALEYLVEASKLLDPTRFSLYIIGSGSEEMKLKELAKSEKNICFLPRVDKKYVQHVLSKFDACYLGWRKNSFYRFGISANKIYEYMLSGKPIIHSVSAGNDPIKDSNCGVSVEPEDSYAIAKAIEQLSNLTVFERDDMGNRGKEFVMKNNLYSILADRYINEVLV